MDRTQCLYGCMITPLTAIRTYFKAGKAEHTEHVENPAYRGGGGRCQPRGLFHCALKGWVKFFQAEIGQWVSGTA